jgi:ACS family tartrate transporter-like MFS transporter
VLWARHSDRSGERGLHVAVPAVVGAVAIAGALYMDSPLLVMVCVTVCAIGVFAAIPPFWALPNAFLTGAGAAAGIGLINSFGNLSGFAGPFVAGWLKDLTGDSRAGMWVVAVMMLMSAAIVLGFRRTAQRVPAADAADRAGDHQQ